MEVYYICIQNGLCTSTRLGFVHVELLFRPIQHRTHVVMTSAAITR